MSGKTVINFFPVTMETMIIIIVFECRPCEIVRVIPNNQTTVDNKINRISIKVFNEL